MSFDPRPLMEMKDAAELNLGKDFINEVCLSNAEVAVILDKQKSNYSEQNKTFTRSLQTLTFPHDEEAHQLEEFEIACLTNLNPEEVEAAVTLIPSLPKHLTDQEIEEVLEIVSANTFRRA